MAPKRVTRSSSAGISNDPPPPQGVNHPPPQQGVNEIAAGHLPVQGAVAKLPIEVGVFKFSTCTINYHVDHSF